MIFKAQYLPFWVGTQGGYISRDAVSAITRHLLATGNQNLNERKEKTTDGFARLLVSLRWYLLVVAIALATASFMLKKDVQFDNSIEGMFPPDNLALKEYQQLKDKFGGTEIVLAVYEDPDLFNLDGSGLKRLRQRTEELKNVRGVIGVLSLAEINDALNQVYTLGNLFNSDDEETAAPILDPADPMATAFLDTFEGYTHAGDGKTAAIVCLLERIETLNIPRSKTIGTLRNIVDLWDGSRITGEPVLLADGFRFIRRDGNRLNQICILLMGVVIIGCFRSLRWMLIPVAVIKLSLWMTLATLAVLNWKLTMVSSMLSAIVAVISVATVVHITVRYREARLKKGHTREGSMIEVFDSLLLPITWTCLTTAAGFFALTLADVKPVSDFGWMMTLGSLFVLLSVCLLVPGLALLGNFDTNPQDTWGEGKLETWLKMSSRAISRYPKQIGLSVAIAVSVIGIGLFYLEVETDFTKNFREDSEIIQAYTFVEERMGGAGLLDVVIRSPNTLNRDFLDRIDGMQTELRNLTLETDAGQPALTHVLSFADANRILETNPVIYAVPPNIKFMAMARVMPGFAAQMKTMMPDEHGHHYFRVMLRTSQRKTAEQQAELIDRIKAIVNSSFPPSGSSESPNTMTTGFFVLLSNLVNSVLADQVKTFLAACVFIGLVILVAFGSLRLVVIALIPNIIPVFGLLGMLGWLGIKMNMGAAMIAAVSMGLSIDGTIHYLTSYRANKHSGLRTAKSIDLVQFRTGRALIYSTIALVFGFGSLCTSEFIPTVFFGGLVSLSMLGGMLGNLIVLPVLLTLLDAGEDKSGRPVRRKRFRKKSLNTDAIDGQAGNDPVSHDSGSLTETNPKISPNQT